MDRTDYKILNLLQQDSRITLRSIGEQVGLTPPAVSERIRKMEEDGVIRSFRVSVDRTLRRMIACGADIQDMEAYVRSAQGMRSLKEQGAELVRRGVTTPEELLRTVSCE